MESPLPTIEVTLTLCQSPSTTSVVDGATGPDVKVPWLAMKLPPSDEYASLGVSMTVEWFRPQTTMKRSALPAVAVLLADGHAAPGVAAVALTTALETSNV